MQNVSLKQLQHHVLHGLPEVLGDQDIDPEIDGMVDHGQDKSSHIGQHICLWISKDRSSGDASHDESGHRGQHQKGVAGGHSDYGPRDLLDVLVFRDAVLQDLTAEMEP